MVHWGQYIWLTYLKPQPETAMLLLYLESVYTYRDDIVTKIPGNIEIGASKSYHTTVLLLKHLYLL